MFPRPISSHVSRENNGQSLPSKVQIRFLLFAIFSFFSGGRISFNRVLTVRLASVPSSFPLSHCPPLSRKRPFPSGPRLGCFSWASSFVFRCRRSTGRRMKYLAGLAYAFFFSLVLLSDSSPRKGPVALPSFFRLQRRTIF